MRAGGCESAGLFLFVRSPSILTWMAKKADTQTERAPMALYRAYRPHNIKEVRGQKLVVSVLEAAVKGDKIAHAYLFAGGRGTGKTSMARILASALGTDPQDIY